MKEKENSIKKQNDEKMYRPIWRGGPLYTVSELVKLGATILNGGEAYKIATNKVQRLKEYPYEEAIFVEARRVGNVEPPIYLGTSYEGGE